MLSLSSCFLELNKYLLNEYEPDKFRSILTDLLQVTKIQDLTLQKMALFIRAPNRFELTLNTLQRTKSTYIISIWQYFLKLIPSEILYDRF